MPAEQFANNASSTLNGAITSVAATLVVTSAAPFPTVPQFRLIIDSELLLVTAVAGTTFTVTRGAEGTLAAAHGNLALVTHILTAGAMGTLQAKITVATTAPVGPAVNDLWVDTT